MLLLSSFVLLNKVNEIFFCFNNGSNTDSDGAIADGGFSKDGGDDDGADGLINGSSTDSGDDDGADDFSDDAGFS